MNNEEIFKLWFHPQGINFEDALNVARDDQDKISREDEKQKVFDYVEKRFNWINVSPKRWKQIKEELTNKSQRNLTNGLNDKTLASSLSSRSNSVTDTENKTSDISESKVDMIAYQLLEKHIEESKDNNSNFCLACIQGAIRRGYKECQVKQEQGKSEIGIKVGLHLERQKLAQEIFDDLDFFKLSIFKKEGIGIYNDIKEKYLNGVKE